MDATNKRLTGKVAIIAGASSGIGLAAAKRFAQEGANVVICGRNDKNVQNAAEELRNLNLEVFGVQCHVGKSPDRTRLIEETIKRYGRLDILVVNAAVNPTRKLVLDTEESEWDYIFHVNVKAAFLLMKEAVPQIRKHGDGGSIIFVSTILAFHAREVSGAYSVSKTALLGLTKTASLQLAIEGIRVNCVAPGAIKTKFLSWLQDEPHITLPWIPMKRIGDPEEVSGTLAFLASDDAKYITGETMVVAGGIYSRL